MFTREFYAAVRGRLNEDGLFLQWLQAYEVDGQTVNTVLATLRNEFACVELWQTNPSDLLLVCSMQPVQYPSEQLRERLDVEPFKTALFVAWRAIDLEGFLARYVARSELVEHLRMRDGAPINTDDHNHLEFGLARSVGRSFGFSIEKLRQAALDQKVHRPPVDGDVNWSLVEDNRVIMYFSREREIPRAVLAEDAGLTTRLRAYRRFLRVDMQGAIAAWEAGHGRPVIRPNWR